MTRDIFHPTRMRARVAVSVSRGLTNGARRARRLGRQPERVARIIPSRNKKRRRKNGDARGRARVYAQCNGRPLNSNQPRYITADGVRARSLTRMDAAVSPEHTEKFAARRLARRKRRIRAGDALSPLFRNEREGPSVLRIGSRGTRG